MPGSYAQDPLFISIDQDFWGKVNLAQNVRLIFLCHLRSKRLSAPENISRNHSRCDPLQGTFIDKRTVRSALSIACGTGNRPAGRPTVVATCQLRHVTGTMSVGDSNFILMQLQIRCLCYLPTPPFACSSTSHIDLVLLILSLAQTLTQQLSG